MKKGILIIDAQNDFFPGGALGIDDADQIIKPIETLLKTFPNVPIYLTQDWHLEDSIHFEERGGQWPPHCIQESFGAEIQKDIAAALQKIFDKENTLTVKAYRKGTDPKNDGGYSAFEAKCEGAIVSDPKGDLWDSTKGNFLLKDLKLDKIDTLIVCGLATDYCVKASVLDALSYGFKVQILLEGIRAVNLESTDAIYDLQEMIDAGAEIYTMLVGVYCKIDLYKFYIK